MKRGTETPITGSRASDPTPKYALGNTDLEHERLIRQAAQLAPYTERFFREAGIGTGQRVLDLGSGVGDIAMLVAGIVGPSGEVVGVERDARSIARATGRVAEAGLCNVSFTQSDVSQIPRNEPFDAAVGRFILMFLPDPVAVLRSVSCLLRPAGILAFYEPQWSPVLSLLEPLPLWFQTASLIRETFRQSGANTEMGLALYRMFQEAGLPAPRMRMEVLVGRDPEYARWFYDLLCSLLPRIQEFNLPVDALGNLATLLERLQAELAASDTVVPWLAPVGVWSRKARP
jgi:ubiquinone/menaquinone biosynthesis C-methylase UbiE